MIASGTAIMGKSECTVAQLEAFLLSKNPNPKLNGISVSEYCQLWITEGETEGVRGDIAFCQMCHETGYLAFNGTALAGWNNYGGIGVTGVKYDPETCVEKEFTGGVITLWTPGDKPKAVGAIFATPKLGVRASIQHCKAYGSTEPLVNPCVDPRFHLVTRGIAPNFEDLGGRWAWPGYAREKYSSLADAKAAGDSYGHSIVKKYKLLKAVEVESIEQAKEELEKYKTLYNEAVNKLEKIKGIVEGD